MEKLTENMIMNDHVAYCGLDCETCEARLATINNDNELRIKVSKEWSKLNGVEITPEMINCSGCRIPGAKTVYCDSLCPIRQCAREKQMETCGAPVLPGVFSDLLCVVSDCRIIGYGRWNHRPENKFSQ